MSSSASTDTTERTSGTIRAAARTRGLDLHPTVKPIAMAATRSSTLRSAAISFSIHSAAAARRFAAERTGRRCYAIELDHAARRYRHRALAANDEADHHSRERQDLRGHARRAATRRRRGVSAMGPGPQDTIRRARRAPSEGRRRRRAVRQESTLEIMERLLTRCVSISVNGQRRRSPPRRRSCSSSCRRPCPATRALGERS